MIIPLDWNWMDTKIEEHLKEKFGLALDQLNGDELMDLQNIIIMKLRSRAEKAKAESEKIIA